MKRLMTLAAAGVALNALAGAVPVVSEATMVQDRGSREVTITYTLADASAVVTLDVQTNATDGTWASIGGENVQNVTGDVWKRVEAGARTILWRPDLSWPNHRIAEGGARAVVTAWSLDNPPDYLVVDLSATAGAGGERYYPAAEFLPGGLLSNDDYRLSCLVLRKIPAKGVTWAMGSVEGEVGRYDAYAVSERLHAVSLDGSYYIGVFPITQAQWALVQSKASSSFFKVQGEMRPVENVCYNEIRNSDTPTANVAFDWPKGPNPDSFLGKLNAKTGLAFDLPSEAQWEFACRAGHGSGYWGDGSPILSVLDDENLARLGRCAYNGGWPADLPAADRKADAAWGPENGTPLVGSYASNDWGLYDMLGGVWEWCLDWYADDITGINGAVNVDPNAPANLLSAAGTSGAKRVLRGGSYGAYVNTNRAARRANGNPADRTTGGQYGFRVALPLTAD